MPDKISDFTEKKIRTAILNKAPLKNIAKGGKHWKGPIFIDGTMVGKVKIPNEHIRIMHENKSQYIARDLQLNAEEFNRFVECTLTGTQYLSLLREHHATQQSIPAQPVASVTTPVRPRRVHTKRSSHHR
ncbi:MAG: hypothetical protein ABSF43_01570 [Rectinemataceae bacterium]|jgi:hypothetical protein